MPGTDLLLQEKAICPGLYPSLSTSSCGNFMAKKPRNEQNPKIPSPSFPFRRTPQILFASWQNCRCVLMYSLVSGLCHFPHSPVIYGYRVETYGPYSHYIWGIFSYFIYYHINNYILKVSITLANNIKTFWEKCSVLFFPAFLFHRMDFWFSRLF